MSRSTRVPLPELIRTVARDWVRSACPEESSLFDFIWNALQFESGAPAEVHGDSLSNLGLPFASKARAKSQIVTPYAIVIVSSVMRELFEADRLPVREEVHDAVAKCAEALGADKLKASGLAGSLSDRILSAFLHERAEVRPPIDPSVELPRGKIHIRWMLQGEGQPTEETVSRKEAVSIVKTHEFDIIVDEHLRHVTIAGQHSKSIKQLSNMQRRMLWLVLANVNEFVGYEDIGRSFEIQSATAEGLAQCLHQHASDLRRLLGAAVAERVLGRASGRGWSIEAGQWSFCWLLRTLDLTESQLKVGTS